MKDSYLVCPSIHFFSLKDEEALFEWIKKIECIEEFVGAGENLYLYLKQEPLSDLDLRDLLALLYRYRIDMTQLAQFITPDNKKWFYHPNAYWFQEVFKEDKK